MSFPHGSHQSPSLSLIRENSSPLELLVVPLYQSWLLVHGRTPAAALPHTYRWRSSSETNMYWQVTRSKLSGSNREERKNWLRRSIVADICRWLSSYSQSIWQEREKEERYRDRKLLEKEKKGNLFQFLLIPVVHIVRASDLTHAQTIREKRAAPLYCSFFFLIWPLLAILLHPCIYWLLGSSKPLFQSPSTLNFFVLRAANTLSVGWSLRRRRNFPATEEEEEAIWRSLQGEV